MGEHADLHRVTAVDYLDRSCRGETDRGRLPSPVLDEAERISSSVGVPVCLISTGPRTFDTVDLGER